jgi:hypothetical protein
MVSTDDPANEGSVTGVSGDGRRYATKVLDDDVLFAVRERRESSSKRDATQVSGYVVSMLKRLFELIGLATMGVGVYFIVVEHSKDNACNTTGGKVVGLGMSASCQHVVYAYFGGFVLLVAGTLVVVFGLLSTRKAAKRRRAAKNPSLASQYQLVDPKSGRNRQS